MSFTDMMSSSRGPGMIGLVIAMLVLCGFGGLAFLSLDHRFQGGEVSIESIIARQAKDIESMTHNANQHRITMEQLPALLAVEKKLEVAKRDRLFTKDKNESLQKGISQLQESIAAKTKEIEDYKDQYRAFARGKVKGLKFGRLEARDGTIYEDVSIREVTPIGMQISYDGGLKCVPFEELPADLQDQFQFDPNQKKAAIAKENAIRAAHFSSVDTTVAATKAQAEQERLKKIKTARSESSQAIAGKQARITAMEAEIVRLQVAIPRESRKGISNAPQLRAQLAKKQNELATLREDLERLRSGL